jgi:hypothetical protein
MGHPQGRDGLLPAIKTLPQGHGDPDILARFLDAARARLCAAVPDSGMSVQRYAAISAVGPGRGSPGSASDPPLAGGDVLRESDDHVRSATAGVPGWGQGRRHHRECGPDPRAPRQHLAMTPAWSDQTGLVTLPSGTRVRGRRLADPAAPADFALVLANGPLPAWPHRCIAWPDFWIPADRADALAALHEAHTRARAGDRVEAACRGGLGRTGTALAALAVLDGLSPTEAVTWVRKNYDRRAIETPWQRQWLQRVR